jgi:ABC-type phosphate transport system auxiliary subunit
MTDQTESASDYAELLRSLDNAKRIYGDGLSGKAAAAIRALEAKVRELEAEQAVERNAYAEEFRRLRKSAQTADEVTRQTVARWEITIADRDRISANYDKLLTEHIKVTDERNEAWQERDRLAGEVERIRTQFDEAIARIKDMLEGDDGQAFKEAGKFLLRIKGRDHES